MSYAKSLFPLKMTQPTRPNKLLWLMIILTLSNLFFSACSGNQPTTGKVEGTVTCEGHPVASVTLRLTDTKGKLYETASNTKGKFIFEDVTPGSYVILASMVTQLTGGFQVIEGLKLEAGDELIKDLELQGFGCQTKMPTPITIPTVMILPSPPYIVPTLPKMPTLPTPFSE